MSRLEAARDLLALLTAAIPPPADQHHALTLLDDATAGAGGLRLSIRSGGTGYTFHLDEADLTCSPEELFAAVMSLWATTDRSAEEPPR